MFTIFKRSLIRLRKALRGDVPFKGYKAESRVRIRFVDDLSDTDLYELNRLLPWNCFVADANGRRFGDTAWRGKRAEPQAIPDRRITLLHDRVDLRRRDVLEVGCFEGVHTVGLCQYAQRVIAIDSRMENVVKTLVRVSMFGYCAQVFKYNIEDESLDVGKLSADVMHHVGVLYHLRDPVKHLLTIPQYIRTAIMLDTHYCEEREATEQYVVDGRTFLYKRYAEYGRKDVFSGMYDHAKWLRLGDIVGLLQEGGFNAVEIIEKRQERNGPRVLLIAKKD